MTLAGLEWREADPGERTSCVYVLLRSGAPLYVGRTGSLRRRLFAHKGKGFDSVLVREARGEDAADLERATVILLRPPLNRGVPSRFMRSEATCRDLQMNIRLSGSELGVIRRAASLDERAVADWVRKTLLSAANLRAKKRGDA